MIVFRSFVYQIFFWVWTLILSIFLLPLLFLPRSWITKASRIWSTSLLFGLKVFCGLNYRIEGQLNLPEGPILLASKHQSAWDTIIMPLIMPGAAVVLKKELTYIPFYGWYLRKYGVIAIERGRKLVAIRKMRSEAKRCLAEGRSIVIFPEGTRVQPQSAKKFQTGVAALYQDLEIPVIPVALNSGCFWSRRSFVRKPGTITLKILSPIRPGLDKQTFLKTLEEGISNAQKTLDPAG